jgi:hypothetical protein
MSAVRKRSTILATALLLAGVVLIFTGQRILTEQSISQMLTYGGLLVLLVAVGLRTAAFATAHGDVRGVEGRLLGAYAGVCGSLVLYALSTAWGAEKLGLSPETAEKVSGPLYVLWTAVVLVSLFAILFIEIVYLRMPIAESVELRRVRTSLQAGVTLALTIIFLLSANYVATARDVRKDVSYFRTTEPSKATLSLVQKLDKPMHVILFYHQGSDVLGQVKPYFDALTAANGKLSYEVTDVALAPELASKHKVRDNGNVLLVTGLEDAPPPKDDKSKDDKSKDDKSKDKKDDKPGQDNKAKIDNSKGEFFRIGTELTESRVTLRKLDATFQQSFTKLTRPERTLYLTVGHGEHNAKGTDQKPEDGTTTMNEILRRLNLKTQDLGLAQGLGSKIPDNASAVLIVGPTEPFVREEVNTLVDYVHKGGRVFAMLEPGSDSGLGPLLESVGVELLPGVAASDTSHMARNYNDSDKGIVFSNRYSSHPSVTTVSRHQREVATVFVNGGGLKQVTGKGESKPRVTFPLRSDPQFWRDLDGNFRRDAQEKTEMMNMMAAVSIDRTGPAAAKPKDGPDAKNAKDESGEGRAVVIADGDFITNKIATNNGNLLLFVDSLAWLVGNEDLSGESSSEEDIAIEHTSDRDKVWFYGTTFVVPLPIALAGVWVARRRRRRAEVKS